MLLGALACIKNHDLLYVELHDESLCATRGYEFSLLNEMTCFRLLPTAGLQEAVRSQQSPLEVDP